MPKNKYPILFRAFPLPAILLLPEGPQYTITDVNTQFLKVTGTEEKDLIGKDVFEAFPNNPNDPILSGASNLHLSLLHVISTRQPQKMAPQKYDLCIKGSSIFETRYWDPENIPILDDQGKVVLIMHVVTDITDKILLEHEQQKLQEDTLAMKAGLESTNNELDKVKISASRLIEDKIESELALIASERKYKCLFDNNPLPMLIWDFETLNIIDCNKESLLKYGYSRKEFLHLTIRDIRLGEDMTRIEEPARSEKEYGKIHKKIWRHQKKNGELMIMEVSGHLIDYNKKKVSLVLLNDITEKVHTEEQREFEELKKEALINSTDDMIWSVSNDFKLIAANRSFIVNIETFEGITFKPGDDLIANDIFPGDYLAFWKECYGRAFSGDSFKKEIYTPAINNRKASWTETSFTPIYKRDRVVTVVCYARNITEKKLANEKLRLSEVRLAVAQEVARVGSWETNLSNMEVIWSDETFRIFEIEKLDFQSSHPSFLEYVHQDDREKVDAAFINSLTTLSVNSIEHRIVTPRGTIKIVEERWHIFRDAREQPIRAVGTCQDITERKKTDMAMQKAYEEKNTILERIDDGFFAVDKNSLVTYWNKRAEILLNTKREDIIGKNLHEIFAPTGSTVFYDNYQKASKKNTTVHFEEFSKRSNKWFAVSAFASENGLSVYFKDVTERKNAEDKIKESEIKYRSFFENSIDGILLTITDGEILAANPAVCKIFQMTEQEICEAGRFGMIDITDPRVEILINERRSTGKATGEITFMRKDRTKFPGEITAVVFKDAYGKERTSMIIRDITERKAAEDKLIATSNSLQSALHDINKIMDSSLDIICAVNEDGYFMRVSAAAETVWGYRPDELVGKQLIDFVYAEDHEKTKKTAASVMAGNNLAHFENRYVRKDGSLVPISWSVRWDAKDRIRYGVARDITGKKRAEKAFEIERQRFHDLFFQAPTSMGILKGPGHIFEMANPLYLQLIGKKDIIGKPIIEVLPEIAEQGFIDILDDVYNTGKSFSANERLIKLDKQGNGKLESIYLNFVYQSHRDIEGIVEGIFFFAIDVTEQVISRKKIEESGNKYRQIVETAQEGIWLIDADNKTSFVNKKMADILEYSPEEMIGKKNSYFLDAEWKQIAHETITRRKLGITENIQFKYVTKNGKEVWTNLSTNPLFDDQGLYNGALAMVTDITESKKVKQHLQLLESVIINTNDSVLITEAEPQDEPGPKILYVNEAFTKMTGYSSAEVIGKTPRILQGPKTDKAELERLKECLLRWEACEITIINYKKNGEEFWINISVIPVANEKGWFTHWISIERDVTESKLAEIHLNQLNEDLQKHAKKLAISNAELEQFAFVASHDLQEPLRMVTSFLTQLEKKYGDIIDEKGKRYIAFAVDGAKRMRQIILELLEFSRIGRIDNTPEDVDLNLLVEDIQILSRKQMEEKNAFIEVHDLPVIHSFRSPLRQVFQNLISNALKYTRNDKPVKIHITASELKTHWQFAVTDNGIGIDPEYFDKIFIIFQRLHNKDEFSGTGMGLAVTKKIIENMGGRIWVESEEGTGSTFFFTIKKII